MNSGGDVPEWQRRLKRKVGENPARFLDQRIPELPESPTSFFRARVDGIDRIEVVGAWIAAERKLATEQGRQPRQHVLDLLEQRRDVLQEHGERPERFRTEWPQDLPDRYNPTNRDRSVPPKDVTVEKADGEVVPWSERPTAASVGRSFDSMTTDAEVATDGGEST